MSLFPILISFLNYYFLHGIRVSFKRVSNSATLRDLHASNSIGTLSLSIKSNSIPSTSNSSIIPCKATLLPDVPFMLFRTSWDFKDVVSFSIFFFAFFFERRRCRCSYWEIFSLSPLFLHLESFLGVEKSYASTSFTFF
jgi:hypothetical protein